VKKYKKPRYQLSIIAEFRKHAFKQAFRKHLNHLIDEIESEVDGKLLKFPGVKAAYFKEVGFSHKSTFSSRTKFNETFENILNEPAKDF
jgi:hypothetical protein|tara:strand:+ start:288 stop:554 length:267 start_codon:yes stop_codon:yes gene_type:complete